jgi:hypothetical protein
MPVPENITNELLYGVLKQIQTDIAELKQARQEMREGFASSFLRDSYPFMP